MILILDVGNSRIRAGVLTGGKMEPLGAIEHRGVGLGPALTEARRFPADIERVVAGCVAGPELRRTLAEAIHDRFGIEAEFVEATRAACGVSNAYPEPARLGADRWADLIGAHARGYEAACIVDAGSALTVDGLISGQHVGGLIIPGLGLMGAALFQETGNLRSLSERPLSGGTALFATDTHEAIIRGTLLAAVSLIQRCRTELAHQVGRSPDLVVTGGDAERLIPLLENSVHLPWLTLEGLVELATGPRGG
jgi:type III pantothenate kinase